MAGSSSDLHSVSQIWLTVQKVHSLSLPDMQVTQRRILSRLEEASAQNPSAKRKASGRKGFEYRADLLPVHAQKALLDLLPNGIAESASDPADLFSYISSNSDNLLFSSPAEMVDDGLNLLSVLNRFIASDGDFVRDDLIPIGLNIRSVLSNLGYKVTSPAPHRQ